MLRNILGRISHLRPRTTLGSNVSRQLGSPFRAKSTEEMRKAMSQTQPGSLFGVKSDARGLGQMHKTLKQIRVREFNIRKRQEPFLEEWQQKPNESLSQQQRAETVIPERTTKTLHEMLKEDQRKTKDVLEAILKISDPKTKTSLVLQALEDKDRRINALPWHQRWDANFYEYGEPKYSDAVRVLALMSICSDLTKIWN
ncbi:hypothetical protein FZEAL_8803 [Fusarium zealandicum]|uniref:Uncharacterized protein n=1 Tax=Fusarium zealandicum TaxID=1053134 RepID=A0A8H4UDR5_9HYPO|nr:hypothetical protein FZEAL_8803 [Fusarium zealandicum]